MSTNDTKAEILSLVKLFADNAILSRKYLWEDSKKQNEHEDAVGCAFDELVSKYGNAGREALATLLSNENDSVASKAAAHLLRYCNHQATSTLKRIAETGDGFNAFAASEALKRWEEGDWDLDPE